MKTQAIKNNICDTPYELKPELMDKILYENLLRFIMPPLMRPQESVMHSNIKNFCIQKESEYSK